MFLQPRLQTVQTPNQRIRNTTKASLPFYGNLTAQLLELTWCRLIPAT